MFLDYFWRNFSSFFAFLLTFAHFMLQKHKVVFYYFLNPEWGEKIGNSDAFFYFFQQNKQFKIFLGAIRFSFTQVFTSDTEGVLLIFLSLFELEKFAFYIRVKKRQTWSLKKSLGKSFQKRSFWLRWTEVVKQKIATTLFTCRFSNKT